jgi:imidazolonepropionase-like amidohydrolase
MEEAARITIPPFIDSHMHFTVEGRPASAEEVVTIMDRCMRRGISVLRDMGHKSGCGIEAKRKAPPALTVRTAGFALYRKGGYGTFLGKGVDGGGEIVAAIKETADAGADFIKVINSGIVSTAQPATITRGGFSAEELKIIVEEARARGLAVVCHANSDESIRNAVTAGASSIEHGFFVSRETLRMMSESGTAWTPTVYALQALAPALAPEAARFIHKVVEDHLSSLYHAASLGVRLTLGTDSGSRGVKHGESLFEELRLWKSAGLSVEQILSAACMDRGEIDRGNFVVVKNDFLTTGKIEGVYLGGTRISS